MVPKEIIEKAQSGGYKIPDDPPKWAWETAQFQNAFALDPTFWQALGKVLGWCKNCKGVGWTAEHEGGQSCYEGACNNCPVQVQCNCDADETWKENAHRFFDLILTGGDTGKFWAELLTPPTNS